VNTPKSLACAFLDTNTLIHFTTFNEMDWTRHLGIDAVCLVIAPSVFRVLDKFKSDASSRKRSTRIRTLISKLRACANRREACQSRGDGSRCVGEGCAREYRERCPYGSSSKDRRRPTIRTALPTEPVVRGEFSDHRSSARHSLTVLS
jgi:hypothetical protein